MQFNPRMKMIWSFALKVVVENSIVKLYKSMQKHVNQYLCLKGNNLIPKLSGQHRKNKYYIELIQVIGVTKKNKQKAHILGKTKSKGFDKTSDNWKVASEDFRAVIKAIKK